VNGSIFGAPLGNATRIVEIQSKTRVSGRIEYLSGKVIGSMKNINITVTQGRRRIVKRMMANCLFTNN